MKLCHADKNGSDAERLGTTADKNRNVTDKAGKPSDKNGNAADKNGKPAETCWSDAEMKLCHADKGGNDAKMKLCHADKGGNDAKIRWNDAVKGWKTAETYWNDCIALQLCTCPIRSRLVPHSGRPADLIGTSLPAGKGRLRFAKLAPEREFCTCLIRSQTVRFNRPKRSYGTLAPVEYRVHYSLFILHYSLLTFPFHLLAQSATEPKARQLSIIHYQLSIIHYQLSPTSHDNPLPY